MMVGVVLICYKDEQEVVNYISKQLNSLNEPLKIVVVDNSCSTQVFNFLKLNLRSKVVENIENKVESDIKVFLIQANENLGYARANNLGAKFLITHFNPKYLLISNSDIEFTDSNVIEKLISKIEILPNVAVIGPKVIGLDRLDQSPYKYQSFFLEYILRYCFFPITIWFVRHGKFSGIISNASEGFYYRLIGCFLLIKTTDFLAVNMFDNNTFLYAEEKILSEKLKKINRYCYYYPLTEIIHKEGLTINNIYNSKVKFLIKAKSEIYYYKNYKNLTFLEFLLGYILIYCYLFLYINPISFIKKSLKNRKNKFS